MGTKKTISVEGKAEISDKKRQQLAAAREKALESRRKQLALKLEQNLSEIRHVLGSAANAPTIEAMAKAMMKQEESLRSKQAQMVSELHETVTSFSNQLGKVQDEVRNLRRVVERSMYAPVTSQKPAARPDASVI